jgi:nitrogen fixation protein FixH
MAAPRPRGWWYPWIFVAAFAVVLAVNLSMVWLATSTFSGVDTEEAYRKGVAYNEALAAARRQEALGWSVESSLDTPAPGEPVAVSVRYRDRDGRPIDGLDLRARMLRPAARGRDHDLALTPLGPGLYGGVDSLPLPGLWDLDVVALAPDGSSHQLRRRFLLP